MGLINWPWIGRQKKVEAARVLVCSECATPRPKRHDPGYCPQCGESEDGSSRTIEMGAFEARSFVLRVRADEINAQTEAAYGIVD